MICPARTRVPRVRRATERAPAKPAVSGASWRDVSHRVGTAQEVGQWRMKISPANDAMTRDAVARCAAEALEYVDRARSRLCLLPAD